jgi:hypothetical protein
MAVRPASLPGKHAEHRFYSLAAVFAILVVFAGFARTFYLKQAFGTPPLSLLLLVHGAVMTAWFLLFIAQTQLVAAGRTDLHRRLGVFGALLALAVLILGPLVAITAARLGHSPGPPPLVFLAIPLSDMLVFAILVGSALWFRRRSDIHKRLMLLATVGVLTAAIARIPLPLIHDRGILGFAGLTILIVVSCAAYDTIRNKRLHPAFLWGGLLIIVMWPLRLWLAGTPQWLQFATWLVR